ncbi:MAG TPA: flagellar protein FliT [Candidatus Latescibacteria bacterium]|nr:flagellar protein FliT [Candidatus Latescibacterota bacterium]
MDVSHLLSTIYALTDEIRRYTEAWDYRALREKLDEREKCLEELHRIISQDLPLDQRRAVGEGIRDVLRANRELCALLKGREDQLKDEHIRFRKGRRGIRAYLNRAYNPGR